MTARPSWLDTPQNRDQAGRLIERLGNCDQCGKGAAWNSPKIDPKIGLQESPLWCDTCSTKEPRFLVTISQHTLDGQRHYGTWRSASYGPIVAHCDKDYCVNAAWIGHPAIPKAYEKFNLYAAEWGLARSLEDQFLRLEDWLKTIYAIHQRDELWCIRCGTLLKKSDVAGYPLFAGAACPPCWKAHLECLNEERRQGHVCRMCGQPYGNCCC